MWIRLVEIHTYCVDFGILAKKGVDFGILVEKGVDFGILAKNGVDFGITLSIFSRRVSNLAH